MGLWNFLFGKRIVVPAPRPKIEEVEEIPKIVLKKERKKLLENSPKRKKPPLTEEQKKEIVGDFAKELSKHIVVGNASKGPLPPLQETKAYQRLIHSGIKLQRPPQPDPNTFIDYDKLVDGVISSLPKEKAPVLTAIGNIDPVCPYCGAIFPKKPKAKTKCRSCGNFVYIRTRPLDHMKVLVTDKQVLQINDQYCIEEGTRASMNEAIKNHLKNYQKSGCDGWRFIGVLDERSPVEEVELHGKIFRRGSAEELSALKVMYRTDCRARPLGWYENSSWEHPDEYYALDRYSWATAALARVPDSERNNEETQKTRDIITRDGSTVVK